MDYNTRIKYIEAELQTWGKRMVERYTWLTIKYEFSKNDETILASFYGDKAHLESEEFCKNVLMFENEMQDKWEDDAPLFCDNEDLFGISNSAKVINNS